MIQTAFRQLAQARHFRGATCLRAAKRRATLTPHGARRARLDASPCANTILGFPEACSATSVSSLRSTPFGMYRVQDVANIFGDRRETSVLRPRQYRGKSRKQNGGPPQNRHWLDPRRCRSCDQLLVRDAAIADQANHGIQPRQRPSLDVALIEPERELVHVAMQVLL